MQLTERAALFIDGSNFHGTVKLLGLNIDYVRLLDYFRDQHHLIRAYYYTALPDPSETAPLRKLIDFLDYNGYAVVSKQTKEFIEPTTGRVRVKGNMDMELALDMLKLAPHIDHAYLFSGDGDFSRLLSEVQDMGVRVTVVSSVKTSPNMVADTLRRQADCFIDLTEIAHLVTRDNVAHA